MIGIEVGDGLEFDHIRGRDAAAAEDRRMKWEAFLRQPGYEQYNAAPEENRAKDHCNGAWFTEECEGWYDSY